MSTAPPNTVLRGGPPHRIPAEGRIRYVPDPDDSLKLNCGSSYEHFERTGELAWLDGNSLRVFSWTHSTYVAE